MKMDNDYDTASEVSNINLLPKLSRLTTVIELTNNKEVDFSINNSPARSAWFR